MAVSTSNKVSAYLWDAGIPDHKISGEKVDLGIIASIKPDYDRFRRLYILICLGVALAMLFFQLALFAVFWFQWLPLEFRTSVPMHLFKYLLLPSGLNFTAVLYAALMHKYYKGDEFVLNMAPIFAMTVICSVSASAHSVYSVTVMLLCLPVFMTAIYGRCGMLYFTSGLCSIGIVAATICRAISPYRKGSIDTKFWPETIGAFVFLVAATIIAKVMIMLLDEQKRRLIESTCTAIAARHEAQAANQAKSEFLANMSHELRTPLNAVIGLTEMIVRKSPDGEVKNYALDVQRAGNALLALVNDVLDISRIESGRVEIAESDYELGSLINDSYNMVAVQWRKKGLTAEVVCDPGLPRVLRGDEYHLRQVIVNLLSNAVKYTESGGIVMKISGGNDGRTLCMEVGIRDSGIGIRKEDMPRLFGKFERMEDARKSVVEGTGLGLSIVKHLVELMGGTIDVESEYGVGSTFTVRVPQKISDGTPIGDIHSTYLDVHGEVERYSRNFEAPDVRILVVDDVPINIEVIRKLLEETKVRVDSAGSGRECLEKTCEYQYDLILMDHMMPGMDGVETLGAMRSLKGSLNGNVPVIMLTANAMSGSREEYANAGFADYLSKPVRGARLEEAILRHLPKEKIVRHMSSDEESNYETTVAADGDSLQFSAVPGLDTTVGLSFCADDVLFYKDMLAKFAEGGKDAVLERAFQSCDWNGYRIAAHSLKGTAKTVGLMELSEAARCLEKAVKDGDTAYVQTHHAGVCNMYRNVIESLRKAGFGT